MNYYHPKIRALMSIIANAASAIFRFGANVFVARGLGPTAYGQLNFSLATVLGMSGFFDFGVTQAFKTFISHEKKPAGIYYWYFAWSFVQFFFIAALIAVLKMTGCAGSLWIGVPISLVVMAFIASYLRDKIWIAVNNIAEAGRKTVDVQSRNFGIAILHFVLVIILYKVGVLSAILVLFLIQIEIIIALFFSFNMVRTEVLDKCAWKAPFGSIFPGIKTYCTPLILYTLVGSAIEFLDRWILQKYGGSVQQGFYSLSYSMGSIIMLIPSSFSSVHWKEVAEAIHAGNSSLALKYYKISCRVALISASSIVGILIPWSKEVLMFFAGSSYVGGSTVFMLMLLFYVFQAFAQITGTTLYALSLTKPLSTIGISTMSLGLAATYFFVGPRSGIVPALNLGGVGLAVKMLLFALITISLQNIIICRTQGWPIDWKYQPMTIGILISAGFVSRYICGFVFTGFPLYITIAVSSLLYVLFAWTIMNRFPGVFGLSMDEMEHYKNTLMVWKRWMR